jgi:hypothetical protein
MRVRRAAAILAIVAASVSSTPRAGQAVPLSQLVPPAWPGVHIVRTEPTVDGLTNAVESYAVDYRDAQADVTRAGLFLARTTGDVAFNHNRKTCRLVADGAIAASVFDLTVAGGHFYYVTTQRDGLTEHALQFAVRILPANVYNIDSRYLGEEYPKQAGALDTISIQIWADTLPQAVLLTQDVLRIFERMGSVAFQNRSALVLPRVLMTRASHFDGHVTVSLANSSEGLEAVKFQGIQVLQPGTTPTTFEFTHNVVPGLSEVSFEVGTMSSIVLYSRDANGFRDQTFVGRGFGFSVIGTLEAPR